MITVMTIKLPQPPSSPAPPQTFAPSQQTWSRFSDNDYYIDNNFDDNCDDIWMIILMTHILMIFADILMICWWYFWWYFDDMLMTNLRLSSSLSRSCLVSCFSTWPWALWWWLLQLWIILWWWWLWISWWWLLRLWWWWLWVSSWLLQLWWPPCSFQLLRRQVRAVAPAQHHEDIFTITMTKISTMMVTQWWLRKSGWKPLMMFIQLKLSDHGVQLLVYKGNQLFDM